MKTNSNNTPQPSWKSYLPNFAILLYMVAMSTYFAGQLPERVPTKFDFQGNVTQYSDRGPILFMIPLLFTVMIFLLPLFVRLSPKRFQLESAKNLIPQTNTAIGLLLGSIHTGILLSALDHTKYSPAVWVTIGMGLFMIFLSRVMGKSERNFFIGFRTPWTLASEKNWRATHNFGAKIMVVTGFWLFFYGVFTKPSLVIAIASLIFAMLIPVFYSLWYYQNFEKGTEADRF